MNNVGLDQANIPLPPTTKISGNTLPERNEVSDLLKKTMSLVGIMLSSNEVSDLLKKTMALVGIMLSSAVYEHIASGAEVNIAWDPNPSSTNINANTTGYKVQWGTSIGNYPNTIDVGNKTDYKLTNLPDGALLHLIVTAYNASGVNGVPSVNLPVQTPYLVPNIPTGLGIQSQNQGEVTINWTPVPNYVTRIYVGTQLGQGIQRYDSPSSDGSINILGLAKRTTVKYYFSISQIDPNTGLESALTYLPGLSAMGVIGTSPLLKRGLRSVSLSNFSTTSTTLNTSGPLTTSMQYDPNAKLPILTISGPQGKKFTIESSDDNLATWERVFTSYMTDKNYIYFDSRQQVGSRFYRVLYEK